MRTLSAAGYHPAAAWRRCWLWAAPHSPASTRLTPAPRQQACRCISGGVKVRGTSRYRRRPSSPPAQPPVAPPMSFDGYERVSSSAVPSCGWAASVEALAGASLEELVAARLCAGLLQACRLACQGAAAAAQARSSSEACLLVPAERRHRLAQRRALQAGACCQLHAGGPCQLCQHGSALEGCSETVSACCAGAGAQGVPSDPADLASAAGEQAQRALNSAHCGRGSRGRAERVLGLLSFAAKPCARASACKRRRTGGSGSS